MQGLAVCPYVGQEQVAEGNAFDSRAYSRFACFHHDFLVVGVGARLRQINIPQRNASLFCLRLDEDTSHRVHGNPVRFLIERS
jgi:hypothetical protein